VRNAADVLQPVREVSASCAMCPGRDQPSSRGSTSWRSLLRAMRVGVGRVLDQARCLK
jgi:hypothetical protein